jgi:hypothetical protein
VPRPRQIDPRRREETLRPALRERRADYGHPGVRAPAKAREPANGGATRERTSGGAPRPGSRR